MTDQNGILTIGHSKHPTGEFIGMLNQHGADLVIDVRSTPYSRHQPQFNEENIGTSLHRAGIDYWTMGRRLGGRPVRDECYDGNGRAQYRLMAEDPGFIEGIERVVQESENRTLALMCTEWEPLDCHRTLLIARELDRRGLVVEHILADGRLEPHGEMVGRLMKKQGISGKPGRRAVAEALDRRGQQAAYVRRWK